MQIWVHTGNTLRIHYGQDEAIRVRMLVSVCKSILASNRYLDKCCLIIITMSENGNCLKVEFYFNKSVLNLSPRGYVAS